MADEQVMLELATQLKKHLDRTKNLEPEIILDILSQLESKPITKSILGNTKVGQIVNDFRKSEEPKIAAKSKILLKKWKDAIQNEPKPKEESKAPAVKEEAEKPVEKGKASGSESKPQSQSQSQPQSQEPLETDPQYFLVKYETGVLIRDKCTKLVFEGLLLVANDDESRTAAAKIASDIEAAVFQTYSENTEGDYKVKMRSLSFNLKDAKNPRLRERVLFGEISATDLATSSVEDLASDAKKQQTSELKKKTINDTKVASSGGARTTQFRCGRCQKNDTSYSQMQTRGADEPMTTFVTCNNCGNKWKFS